MVDPIVVDTECSGEPVLVFILVEVAGIEPASADLTLTGNYMFSLHFKLTDQPIGRQTVWTASPIGLNRQITGTSG